MSRNRQQVYGFYLHPRDSPKAKHVERYNTAVLADGEPEYDQDARSKLAAAGLTSDEEEEGQGGASGFDSDSHPAEAGQDATDAVRKAPKGNRKQKRDDKPSRSRSKSRERGTKGTPRLKKRAREPGQALL